MNQQTLNSTYDTQAIQMVEDLTLFPSDRGLDAVYQHAVQVEAELSVKKLSYGGYLQTTMNGCTLQ